MGDEGIVVMMMMTMMGMGRTMMRKPFLIETGELEKKMVYEIRCLWVLYHHNHEMKQY